MSLHEHVLLVALQFAVAIIINAINKDAQMNLIALARISDLITISPVI